MNDPSRQTAWERWELGSFAEQEAPRQPGRKLTPTFETTAAAAPAPASHTGAPDGAQPQTPAAGQITLPTAAEIEQMHIAAREEGLARGREEGLAAGREEGLAAGREEGLKQGREEGRKETLEQAKLLAAATQKLERELTRLEEEIAGETLALAIELARAVIREDVAARPQSLLTVVREALAQLPHQHANIYLQPEDAALLRSLLGDQLGHAGHRIHEDFNLGRGDCLVEAGGARIDASIAMRWRRVLASLGLSSAWRCDDEAGEHDGDDDGAAATADDAS